MSQWQFYYKYVILNGDGVSNHRCFDSLRNRLFWWYISKKTPKLRVTGLCERNSPVISEFHAQKVSNAEIVFIWWHHHVTRQCIYNLCDDGHYYHTLSKWTDWLVAGWSSNLFGSIWFDCLDGYHLCTPVKTPRWAYSKFKGNLLEL